MKKLLLVLIFILALSVPMLVLADTGVCGKSYKWNDYSMKFLTSPFGPGCGGNVEITGPDKQNTVYQFVMSDVNFVTVFDIGEFVLRNSELIFLYPDGILFTEY